MFPVRKRVLPVLVLLAACGGVPGAAPAAAAQNTAQDSARMARTLGSPTAPITVYEMSDFQCPFCRRHAIETMPQLVREYIETGKVQWTFINLPITEIHPNALPAAEFAICAARGGKFWPAHHLLFRHQKTWADMDEAGPFFLSLADSVGLARQETLTCLQDSTIRMAIRAEAEGSMRAGATSTPTFYIEGGLLVGAQPVEVFRGILDSIYERKSGRAVGR